MRIGAGVLVLLAGMALSPRPARPGPPMNSPVAAPEAPESEEVQWRLVGPGGGGWIQSIAWDPQDPNILYVGGDVGGFYVSFNGEDGRSGLTR